MKKVLIAVSLGIFLVMAVGSVYAVERFVSPTGLVQYDPTKAYPGYVLFNQMNTYTQYLMDLQGNVVHTWETDYVPGLYGYLLEDGTLIRGAQDPDAATVDTYGVLSGPRCGRTQEIDWDGNVTLNITHMSEDSISHHDFRKIWNSELGEYTYLRLAFERMTAQDAIDWGADPTYEDGYTNDGNGWSLDAIVEMDADSNVIWKWCFKDHLCQSYDDTKLNYVEDISAHPEKLDLNFLTPVGGVKTDWNHCNSLDYNQELGQICVNAKRMSEFYVIDHDGTFVAGDPETSTANAATEAGDFMYRWGNPCVYGQGDPPGYYTEGDQQMYGAHNIQWIGGANSPWDPSELPGGGNFLIFDNGCWCPTGYHSESIEINGYLDADGNDTGSYVNPPDAGYTTAGGMMGGGSSLSSQVAWNFKSNNINSFYAMHISGTERLPNGNTAVCSGTQGHFFEVTEDGEVVWEYQNPVTSNGITAIQTDSNSTAFSVFRIYRYGPDFAGFADKDLTPQGTLADTVTDPLTRVNGLLD